MATSGSGSDGAPDVADRYTIASKVREEYYLGFHTALELHGCAYSWFNSVTVCLGPGAHFRSFEFQGTTNIGPGEYIVVAQDPDTIRGFYGSIPVVGPFEGRLDNQGEDVVLRSALLCL